MPNHHHKHLLFPLAARRETTLGGGQGGPLHDGAGLGAEGKGP